jgi:hypothetical protein
MNHFADVHAFSPLFFEHYGCDTNIEP